ncbi:MAG: DNA translocase FtsK, partial [Bacteroidota bacterium]
MGKSKKKKKDNIFIQLKQFFSDERVKVVVGIFCLTLAVIIFLAFVSYLFTWKIDQSFENDQVFSSAEVTVDNWSGKIGAWVAEKFLKNWLGFSSFFIPFLLVIIGFRFFKIRVLPLRKTTRLSIVGAVILSIILSYLFESSEYLGSGPGGYHGYFMNKWLNAFMGKTGTGLLLFFIATAFVVFSFNNIYLFFKSLLRGEPLSFKNLDEENDLEKYPQVDNTFSYEVENMKNNFEVENGVKEETIDPGDDFFSLNSVEKDAVDQENPQRENINEDEDLDIKLTIEERKQDDTADTNNIPFNPITEKFDPSLDLPNYKIPPIDLLEDYQTPEATVTNEELISNKNKIVETLGNYKIQIDKIKATIGPTVTLYEIVPAPGVKISKIKNLEDDIALSLAALGIRIIAPIPGRGTIGIEVPNQKTEIVSMRSILTSKKFQESKFELPIAIGKNISNETYVFDLAKMPHLLVAGATGQGKSVGLNAIITSLLYKNHPSNLKMVMIDPKKVELTLYSKIERHFLAKLPDAEEAIITDTQKVIHTLNSLTLEMDERYNLLKMAFVRNIKEYNAKYIDRKLNPEKGHRFLPYIVVIIDEFADLIMTAGKEIELPIARLAQLARAIGIHLIIATQRPTTNIITGMIKANFPARIAFRVTSMIDSRTILDSPGANQLIGRGDMLISLGSDLVRVQCAFVDIPELDRITDFIGSQQAYPSAFMLPEYDG